MELTLTCCFEFERKRRADSKQLFLHTFCFYFMVAGFTYLSPLPEVDNKVGLLCLAFSPAMASQIMLKTI